MPGGWSVNRHREERLELCRRLLLVAAVREQLSAGTADVALAPAQVPCCPQCGGTRLVREELPAGPPLPDLKPVAAPDSS